MFILGLNEQQTPRKFVPHLHMFFHKELGESSLVPAQY